MSKEPKDAFTGILRGWDTIIQNSYGLKDHISSLTAAREALKKVPDLGELFGALFYEIERNFSEGTPSPGLANSNWELRRAGEFSENTTSLEKRLEKRAVNPSPSALNGGDFDHELNRWFNQMPAGSGYVGSDSNKGSRIDLVYQSDHAGENYVFVELKLFNDSGTPIYAAFEILSYGFLYLFTRKNLLREFEPVPDRQRVLNAKVVQLIVLAPESYYTEFNRPVSELNRFAGTIDEALRPFAKEIVPELRMSFEFWRYTAPISETDAIDSFTGFKPAPYGEALSDPA